MTGKARKQASSGELVKMASPRPVSANRCVRRAAAKAAKPLAASPSAQSPRTSLEGHVTDDADGLAGSAGETAARGA